ncbi:MAG: pyrrolo-quinoline quinone, partial [Pirellulales bacterium]
MPVTSLIMFCLWGLMFFVLAGTRSLAAAEPDGWPQWRGPRRDGHTEGRPWPDRLSGDALEQLWRIKLGESYSGPVVADDRLITTETLDRESEIARAVNRKTGETLW